MHSDGLLMPDLICCRGTGVGGHRGQFPPQFVEVVMGELEDPVAW